MTPERPNPMRDEIIEVMARAIEVERWRIAIEQVSGKSISSPEGSRRTSGAALQALLDGGYAVLEFKDLTSAQRIMAGLNDAVDMAPNPQGESQ